MKTTAQRLKDSGYEVTYFAGPMWVRGADGIARMARGVFTGQQIFIQADNRSVTIRQIADHELFHDLASNDMGLVSAIEEAIIERFSPEEFAKIVNKYQEKLNGLYEEEDINAILEEIFADAYAGINSFSAGAPKFASEAHGAVESRSKPVTAQSAYNGRAPPEKYIINDIVPDEEFISDNRNKLSEMNSVSELTGNEFPKGEIPLRQQVNAYYTSLGNNMYNDILGDVELKDNGINDSIRHGLGKDKAVAFAAVPNVIKNGVIINYEQNYKGRNYDTAVLAAPITINNAPYYEAVVVMRNKQNQRFYVHEVITEEKALVPFTSEPTAASGEGIRGSQDLPLHRLLQKIVTVNKESGVVKAHGDNTRFSLNEDFPEQFDRWIEETDESERLTDGDYFNIGTISEPLKMVGVRKGSIYWRKQKIGYIMDEHPEIEPNIIKSVPDMIENPVIIMKSQTREDSIVLFGEVKTADGRPVMASLELTPKAAGNMEAEFTLLTSAYGRTKANVKNLVENSELLYLAEKNRANTWLMSLRVQFPSNQSVYGSAIGSISYTKNGVNIKGVPFKEILEDSGKLKLSVYEEADDKLTLPRPEEAERIEIPGKETVIKARKEAEESLKNKLMELFPVPGDSRKESAQAVIKLAAEMDRGTDANRKTLDNIFKQLYESVRVEDLSGGRQDYKAAVDYLRGRRIYVEPGVKADFGDDWNSVRKRAFGHGVYFTNNKSDSGLDTSAMELSQAFPGFFNGSHTDLRQVVEDILSVFDRAEARTISLDEEARQFGGEAAVKEYKNEFEQKFYAEAFDYYRKVYGVKAARDNAILQAAEARKAELGSYVDAARQVLRQRAASMGESIPAAALPKGMTAEEFYTSKKSVAEADRAERMRPKTREEFKATSALSKLGIKIAGSVTDYRGAESLRNNDAAAKSIRRELEKAEKRLRPSAAEREFASGLASGVYEDSLIPASMDREKILDLADYYMAERALGESMIRRRRQDINFAVDETVEELYKDSDEHVPLAMLIMNNRTAQRNMLSIFGDEDGRRINEWLFDPVAANEAERYRFFNRELDRVRTFASGDGKQRRLNKAERAIVQQVIEGRAVAEAVASNEMKAAIESAAENIRKGEVAGDAAREFSLGAGEQKLAVGYARWLEAKERLESGEVDSLKVENAVRAYTERFNYYYDAVNDFLVVHGYEPIGFIKGYAPHLQPEENHNLLNKAFEALGINTDVSRLPASIAGLTADYKPNKRWNPYFLQRTSDVTEYDIAAAFESYVAFLSDVLYHTDDIIRVRRASDYFRRTYAPDEIRNNIEWAEGLRTGSTAEKTSMLREAGKISAGSSLSARDVSETMDKYIEELYATIKETSKYSDFVMYLDNYANKLAGKQSMADRGTEGAYGRAGKSPRKGVKGLLETIIMNPINIGNKLTRGFALANVAGNLSSVLNQTAQLPMILSENGMINTTRAMSDIVTGKLRRAGFNEESDFLTGKKGISYIVSTPGEMVTGALFKPAELADRLMATLAVRGAYLKALGKGASHLEAVKAGDRYATAVMGSRMKGSRPLAFENKNPVSQMAHIFQTEILNSWEHLISDLPRDFREIEKDQGKGKAALALSGVIVKMLISAFLMNRLDEELYGGTPAPFDLLGLSANFIASGEGLSTNRWLETVLDNGWEKLTGERLFGTDELDERDFDWSAALEDTGYNVSNEVPFVRNVAGLLGLGDSTLPWPDMWGAGSDLFNAVSEDGLISGAAGEAGFDLATQLIPGGRQINKTAAGVKTAVQGGRYYGYGEEARLQYPVEGSAGKAVQAGLFGNSGLSETRDFYASGAKGLTVKQTELYRELIEDGADINEVYRTIQEYRQISNDDDMSAYVRGKLGRDLIRGAELSDEQRLILYRGLNNADSRAEDFKAMMNAGLDWDEVMDSYDKYAELNENEELDQGGKAAELAYWADKQGFTKKQATVIKERLTFYSSLPAEGSRYESFVEAGMDEEDALDTYRALDGLESGAVDLERYLTIAKQPYSEEIKDMALSAVMSESAYEKYGKVREAGISSYDYFVFLEDISDIKANVGLDGKVVSNSKKDKIVAVINGLKLTPEQKDALFLLQGYLESGIGEVPWRGKLGKLG